MPEVAAIIAVGAELLSGQTTNRNAVWLSNQLFSFGIDTRLHLTVDDIERDIVEALNVAAKAADLIFVTGGLGPTSDDLTRQAIAKWAGQELEFDPASWAHIETVFQKFARRVPETNRQQCFFPKGARVLTNAAGTANAFSLIAHGKSLFIFPGPPLEVETVWEDHLKQALIGRIPIHERRQLRMFRTVGKGESHLAELVEPILKAAGPGLDVAYRAHVPYVELKLRFPMAESQRYAPICAEIETALSPWLYEVDNENTPELLAAKLAPLSSVNIYDGVTQGHLIELLGPFLRTALPTPAVFSSVTSWEEHASPTAFVEQALELESDATLSLAIAGLDASGIWAIGLRQGDEKRVEEKSSIYKGDAMRPRNLKAIAALACKEWWGQLNGLAKH